MLVLENVGHFRSHNTSNHIVITHLIASFMQNEGLSHLVVEEKLEVLGSMIIDNEDPICYSYLTKGNLVMIRIKHFCSSGAYRWDTSHYTIFTSILINAN